MDFIIKYKGRSSFSTDNFSIFEKENKNFKKLAKIISKLEFSNLKRSDKYPSIIYLSLYSYGDSESNFKVGEKYEVILKDKNVNDKGYVNFYLKHYNMIENTIDGNLL